MCIWTGDRGLVHQGLLHPATADLAATLAPLIAHRLAHGQPVLAVLPTVPAAGVRARLPTRAGLHITDPVELYRHPGRVLSHYRAWIADMSPDGEPVTIVAAPEPHRDDKHRAALWMHIDAVTTLALAECALTLVCVYPDDPGTADTVRRTHPSLFNGAPTPNPDHLPAEQFLALHPLPPPIELAEPDIAHSIDHFAQLSWLRRVVAGHLAGTGLSII